MVRVGGEREGLAAGHSGWRSWRLVSCVTITAPGQTCMRPVGVSPGQRGGGGQVHGVVTTVGWGVQLVLLWGRRRGQEGGVNAMVVSVMVVGELVMQAD